MCPHGDWTVRLKVIVSTITHFSKRHWNIRRHDNVTLRNNITKKICCDTIFVDLGHNRYQVGTAIKYDMAVWVLTFSKVVFKRTQVNCLLIYFTNKLHRIAESIKLKIQTLINFINGHSSDDKHNNVRMFFKSNIYENWNTWFIENVV